PSESRFSLPPKRYFQRHHLPPAGLTSRYRPPPSKSFTALACGLARRIAVSVSGMWGQLLFVVSCCPQSCPTSGGSFGRKAWDHAGHYPRKNPLVTVGCWTSSVPLGRV